MLVPIVSKQQYRDNAWKAGKLRWNDSGTREGMGRGEGEGKGTRVIKWQIQGIRIFIYSLNLSTKSATSRETGLVYRRGVLLILKVANSMENWRFVSYFSTRHQLPPSDHALTISPFSIPLRSYPLRKTSLPYYIITDVKRANAGFIHTLNQYQFSSAIGTFRSMVEFRMQS